MPSAFVPDKGINPGIVEQIAWYNGEPDWMTKIRLRSLRLFDEQPMAEWLVANMPDIDFQDIYYCLGPEGDQIPGWNELPKQSPSPKPLTASTVTT